MNLVELDEQYNLRIDPAVWGLSPFKALFKRDKSKNKDKCFKEVNFIYFYCDIRSDYMYILDEDKRIAEIKKDLELPESWTYDKLIAEAVDFYKERSTTVIGLLYQSALKGADAVRKQLEKSEVLLAERDSHGKPIHKIADITRGLKDVKVIMQDLKAAEKEVLKEKKETEGRMKGSKQMGMFEEGFNV